MQTLRQFDEVIAALGGGSATGRLCKSRPSAVCNWRRRQGRFPCRYYWEIRCALYARGYRPALHLFNFYEGAALRPLLEAERTAA